MIILVLGGARSGKSTVGEALASRLPPPVTYVATLLAGTADADLAARIHAHRARRPPAWATLEAGAELSLVDALRSTTGTVMVDSLGPWVAAAEGLDVDPGELCEVLAQRRHDSVLVSEEVGMGVHPSSEVGRRFRDRLGEVNQAVAAIADEVLLVVAGRALRLDPVLGP
ncbi:MAG TPA: bifunctional adenosylcobinamide kinase/adenosylcobinamide-phosphate guanylyltransferase [Acidimicrobiales bacterium]|nr:bifunctional adenosylcobinamide kinase/adenosylcobinamide-phosphate guanylyltransferase [Acidimicrobiales bacterium]